MTAFARITTTTSATGVALLTTLVLAGCSDDSSDDKLGDSTPIGGSSSQSAPENADAADDATTLSLTTGSSLELNEGVDANAEIDADAEKVPLLVSFESVECAQSFPRYGLDPETYDEADFVAGEGKQACLVELSVKNAGTKPTYWGSTPETTLRTSDGVEFSASDQSYSDQTIAASKKRTNSNDTNYTQPGATEYDYVIYEIPADATPDVLVFN